MRHDRRIDAPVGQVWELIATGEGLATWLGRVSNGAPGAERTIAVVHDEDDPGSSTQISTITRWDPPKLLEMTWDFPGEPTSHLSIRLTADGDATQLVLVHRGVGREGDDYLAGWHSHLDVLTASAEGWGMPTFGAAYRAAEMSIADR